MYINEIPYLLSDIIYEHEENQREGRRIITHKQKILIINDGYYYAGFTVGGKSPFNPAVIDNSHDKYISATFELHVETLIKKDLLSHSFVVVYNLNNEISHSINIVFSKLMKDNEFIYTNEQHEKDLNEQQCRLKELKEKANDQKWKSKVYSMIVEYGEDGIDLTEMIQKTRGIKIPMKRKHYLDELVRDNQIKMIIDRSKGKMRRVYIAT